MANNPARTPNAARPQPGGAIPHEPVEDLSQMPEAEARRRLEEAGNEARAAEAAQRGTGEGVFRASLARAPAVPQELLDKLIGQQPLPGVGAAPPAPGETAPEPPPGYALFQNPTEDLVVVKLRGGDNRPRVTKIPAGKWGVFEVEYIDVVKNHAPQLVLVKQRAAEQADDA